MKTRSLSLIELLVCLVFLSLITTSLFQLLSRYATYSSQLSQVKYQELNRQKCLFRLKTLISQGSGNIKEEDHGFSFSFENGVDQDPFFCHDLQASVREEGNKLILSYGKDNEHQRKELLYAPLSSFSYTLDEDQALIITLNEKPYPLFLKP